ncbi:STAS domain-containing protein [Nonomuraea sp. LPB2021202275-12-8]|uniref:STAS domain-containing protein n=1 Tax=Nonomuraea sp. LPB2021202275-12-8 TaxID=3120159 RepID=UPI00300CA32C
MWQSRLALHVDDRQDVSVVRLDGELDLGTDAYLVGACADLIARDRVKIVVDVSGLGFCDCSGLSALIAEKREAERRGGYLRLVGVHGLLARLLTVAELADAFPPYADLRQACC